jgi:hypothetical protein
VQEFGNSCLRSPRRAWNWYVPASVEPNKPASSDFIIIITITITITITIITSSHHDNHHIKIPHPL